MIILTVTKIKLHKDFMQSHWTKLHYNEHFYVHLPNYIQLQDKAAFKLLMT